MRATIIVGSLVLFSICVAVAGSDEPSAGTGDMQTIVDGNNGFALDLYGQLRPEEGNLFVAPHSISTALAMTYAGARGETATQMRAVLHFTLPDDRLHGGFLALDEALDPGACELAVANRLWPARHLTLIDPFLHCLRDSYGAGLEQLDFGNVDQARRTINGWISEQTRKRIPELLQDGDIDPGTELVLTNAIYFKGSWARAFEPEWTREAPFRLTADETVDVMMMTQTADFRCADHGDLKVVELPYESEMLSMFVLLPAADDGLPALEESLTTDTLNRWLSGLTKTKAVVSMPRFKMKTRFNLRNTLVDMGMGLAFSPRADFSGMTGDRGLFIDKVITEAFVEVNEEGTEAAGATAVTMKRGGPRPLLFQADHPFLFVIRHNTTGAILFLGRVVNPAE